MQRKERDRRRSVFLPPFCKTFPLKCKTFSFRFLLNTTGQRSYYWGWPGNVDVYNYRTLTDRVIFVDAEVSEDSRIGVWSYQEPEAQSASKPEIVVTRGLKGKGTLDQFFCDRPYNTSQTDKHYPYKMTLNDAGEAVIRCVHLINLDANGGTGEMETQEVIAGYYNLPECEFTAPSAADGSQL